MVRRLLVMGAGAGASNNLIASLRAGDPSFHVVGTHHDRFVLRKSPADRNYLVLPSEHPRFVASLQTVLDAERVDLLIPNSDGDVRAVARRRGRLRGRVFLPRTAVIERCQDKY